MKENIIKTHYSLEDNLVLKKPGDYLSYEFDNFKPKGIWYEINGSWLEWCSSEMPDWLQKRYKNAYDLEIDMTDVLLIDTNQKLMDFTEKYKINTQLMRDCQINWLQVSKDYKGIEISPYNYHRRMEFMWYYPWDVASGCIWDITIIKLLKVKV